MKKEWIFLLIVFLQFGCIRKNNHIDNENVVVDSIVNTYIIEETKDDDVKITKSKDNISFLYVNISKSEYEILKENSINEILSLPREKFEETNQGLSIKLPNEKNLSFVNNDGVECESCIEMYHYVGFSEIHNIHVYSRKLYESTEYFLVNEQSMTYQIFGMPSFLKNNDLMICSLGMLGIQGASNGFQLYSVKNGSIKLIKQEDLEDWIPNDAFWINDNELIMLQDFPYDGESLPSSKYIKITIITE